MTAMLTRSPAGRLGGLAFFYIVGPAVGYDGSDRVPGITDGSAYRQKARSRPAPLAALPSGEEPVVASRRYRVRGAGHGEPGCPHPHRPTRALGPQRASFAGGVSG